MCASSSDRAAAFLSKKWRSAFAEVADGNINVQSACALNTVYFYLILESVRYRLRVRRRTNKQ
jgi:hypothetical protein